MCDFNVYDFNDPNTRKKMRYLVVMESYSDLNNACAFKSLKDLKEYLGDEFYGDKVEAVFKVDDITAEYL